jgi:uncharacterized protein
MDAITLELVFRQVFSTSFLRDPIRFVWHGGEPLVVGTDFYRRAWNLATKLARDYGRTFSFGVQTNGTLIDESWCHLFRDVSMVVGVSLDGPALVHDVNRVARHGQGTHAQVLRGVRSLQVHGIPFGVIAVLTEQSLKEPDAMFDFFVANGIPEVGFNVEEIEGANRSSSVDGPSALNSYHRFFYRIMERLLLQDPPRLRVRELETMVSNLLSGEAPGSNSMVSPGDVITFTYDGCFTTFSPELCGAKTGRFGRFVMGNVRTHTLADLWRSPLFNEVNSEIQTGVEECRRTCQYWSVCGGGSPSNKFWETGRFDVTETAHCRATVKTLVDSVLDFLDNHNAVAV